MAQDVGHLRDRAGVEERREGQLARATGSARSRSRPRRASRRRGRRSRRGCRSGGDRAPLPRSRRPPGATRPRAPRRASPSAAVHRSVVAARRCPLAPRGARQHVEHDDGCGHLVRRELFREARPQRHRVELGAGLGRDVGHQSGPAPLVQRDRGLRGRRDVEDRPFDLHEVDAVAPHLHQRPGAAVVLERAVAPQPSPVAGTELHAPGSSGSGEKWRAVWASSCQ